MPIYEYEQCEENWLVRISGASTKRLGEITPRCSVLIRPTRTGIVTPILWLRSNRPEGESGISEYPRKGS